jgi:hypothetical protein
VRERSQGEESEKQFRSWETEKRKRLMTLSAAWKIEVGIS